MMPMPAAKSHIARARSPSRYIYYARALLSPLTTVHRACFARLGRLVKPARAFVVSSISLSLFPCCCLLVLAMGACATKPGDLKVKGEAPLVVEDAAAVPVVAGEEKAKAADGAVVMAAAEADPADASRRRSLSDLLKQDAETSDGEADDQEAAAEKAVAVEPVTSAAAGDDAGATMGGAQAPVHAQDTTELQDSAAGEVKEDPHGEVPAAVEEEKRVDPDSVQVVAPPPADDAALPSAEESKVADDASV